MSPELFDPNKFGLKESRPTKESDCYALGMVMYEVLSGQTPHASWNQLVVIQKILDGERPRRPHGTQGAWFTDDLWGMLELCWKPHPDDRPALNTVLQCLQDATRLSGPPSDIGQDVDDPSAAADDSRTFSLSLPGLASDYPWLYRTINCT